MNDIEAALPGRSSSDSLSHATTATNGTNIPMTEITTYAESSTCEVEQQPRLTGKGHHEIAEFMCRYPAAAIFRRFKSLHMLKLLYLQATLLRLEEALKFYAQRDMTSGERNREDYCRNFGLLEFNELDPETLDRNDDQRTIWLEIRQVLAEYDETLRNTTMLLDMPKADKKDLQLLQRWMDNEGNIALTGQDAPLWKETPQEDLMAMAGRTYEDAVTKLVEKRFMPHFIKVIGARFHKPVPKGGPLSGMIVYDFETIGFYISLFVISVASVLPLIAVGVLSIKLERKMKLGLIALFTVVFSFFLGGVSGSKKKVEVITASAAFMAVQVVFISGDSSCVNSGSAPPS